MMSGVKLLCLNRLIIFGGIDDDTLKVERKKTKPPRTLMKLIKPVMILRNLFLAARKMKLLSRLKMIKTLLIFRKEKLGLSNDQASALGLIGAAGLTLDAPTGGGQFYKIAIKTFGKKGIESLAKETTESGIKQMVKLFLRLLMMLLMI